MQVISELNGTKFVPVLGKIAYAVIQPEVLIKQVE